MQNLIACWQRSDEEWEANNNNSQHNGPSSGFGGKQVLGNHPKHAFDPTKKPSPPVPPNGLLLPRNSHQPQAKDKQQGEGEKAQTQHTHTKKELQVVQTQMQETSNDKHSWKSSIECRCDFFKTENARAREKQERGRKKYYRQLSHCLVPFCLLLGALRW